MLRPFQLIREGWKVREIMCAIMCEWNVWVRRSCLCESQTFCVCVCVCVCVRFFSFLFSFFFSILKCDLWHRIKKKMLRCLWEPEPRCAYSFHRLNHLWLWYIHTHTVFPPATCHSAVCVCVCLPSTITRRKPCRDPLKHWAAGKKDNTATSTQD